MACSKAQRDCGGRDRVGCRHSSAPSFFSSVSGHYSAIPFAAAIAACTPDFSRIALIFDRAAVVKGRSAAMYRPCCWWSFRVAAEILGFRRTVRPFAVLTFRAVGKKPSLRTRRPALTITASRAASFARRSRIRRSRRWGVFLTSLARSLPSWMRTARAC